VLGASALAAGFDPQSLELLAAGAAAHAKTLLDAYLDDGPADDAQLPSLVPDLDAYRDAVRLLSGEHRDVHVFARLVDTLGVGPRAWRAGSSRGGTPAQPDSTSSKNRGHRLPPNSPAPEPCCGPAGTTRRHPRPRLGATGGPSPNRTCNCATDTTAAGTPTATRRRLVAGRTTGHDPADVLAGLL